MGRKNSKVSVLQRARHVALYLAANLQLRIFYFLEIKLRLYIF